MTSTDSRLPVLDGLRATSILLVMACHMLPLGPKVLRLNDAAGAMGMSLFFALSGFLITSGLLHNSNVPEFLVRRLTRIVPLAYAYTFLVTAVLAFDPDTMLWMLSFLLNFRDHLNSDNAHFWSLCVEVQFYLGMAVVVAGLGRRGIWLIWPACLLVTAMRIGIGESAYYNIQTHLRVDEILVGACVASLYRPSWTGRLPWGGALFAVSAVVWFATSSPATGWLQFLRPYATACLLVAALSLGKCLMTDILSSRPMRYIAAISYALYVLHPITVHGWFNDGSPFERYLLKRPISFVLAFLGAHLSTFYWERYWQQAGRQWIEERRKRRLQSAV